MARTVLAPTHRLTAPARYVCVGDTAWNHDILNLAWEPGREFEGHSLDPLHAYLLGETRYDLAAAELRDLIEATKVLDVRAAEVWTLRVLPFDERFRVDEMAREGYPHKARLTAFLHSVIGLEGAEGKAGEDLAAFIATLPTKRDKRDIDRFCTLVADYAYSVVEEVGQAAIMVSRDMSVAEKKS